jgi:hypothetical protein
MGRVKGMGAEYPLTALLCVKKGVNWDIVELLFVECSVKDVIIKKRKEKNRHRGYKQITRSLNLRSTRL